MIQCLNREQLRAFLSGGLSIDVMESCSEHINACVACQDAADQEADDSVLCHEYRDCLIDRLPYISTDSIPSFDVSTVSVGDVNSRIPSDNEQPAPRRLGRYKLKRLIARGGFGEVWEAYDPALRRAVAIKMMRRDRRLAGVYDRSFQEEGQKLASLRHPGVVHVYDVGRAGDQIFIVTELLSGGTLATRLEHLPISLSDAARLLAKVARAAHAAHQAGLIHRDIKPANIVLDADGEPRLSDFGLAVNTDNQHTESPGAAGTIPYMSPEQAAGQNPHLDARSDIYSLGVVFYQMLTGRLPHRAESISALRKIIQTEPPLPLRQINSAIPVALESLCLKCLSKTLDDRFASARELADSLDAWDSDVNLSETEPDGNAVKALGNADWSPGQPLESRKPPNWSNAFRRAIFGWKGIVLVAGFLGLVFRGDFSSRNLATPYAKLLVRDDRNIVRIITKPEGARVVVYPIESRHGLPDGGRRQEANARTPTEMRLAAGFYLVVAALEDGRFHEVYRTVRNESDGMPKSYAHLRSRNVGGVLEWPEIEIPGLDITDGMGLFSGDSKFSMGEAGNSEIPQHQRSLHAFYLDPHEVAVAELLAENGNELPASLAHLRGQLPPGNFPVSGIWWNDAVRFAEKIGKRLPTEAEYEFAATAGGTRHFPWGDAAPSPDEWPLLKVGEPAFDRVDAGKSVYGLFSNVAEWTASPAVSYPVPGETDHQVAKGELGDYIVRGGPNSVIQGSPASGKLSVGPRTRIFQHERALGHKIGMRCARSINARLLVDDLESVFVVPDGLPKENRGDIKSHQSD